MCTDPLRPVYAHYHVQGTSGPDSGTDPGGSADTVDALYGPNHDPDAPDTQGILDAQDTPDSQAAPYGKCTASYGNARTVYATAGNGGGAPHRMCMVSYTRTHRNTRGISARAYAAAAESHT
ncbi:hypothetical protein FACS1894184_03770 [Clostridia bacterium]|nr:hypothetical protein FACS1894184_03770 [Clostridia bacterium]